MTEPPARARVPVDDTRAQPDPARTGCLSIGGILGVIGGVVFVFFGVPPLLNFLFPGDTIEVGESYEDDTLSISVAGVEDGLGSAFPSQGQLRLVVATLNISAKSTWKTTFANFVMEFDDGREIPAQPVGSDAVPPIVISQGTSAVKLGFYTVEDYRARPFRLHVREPALEFELPEPTAP